MIPRAEMVHMQIACVLCILAGPMVSIGHAGIHGIHKIRPPYREPHHHFRDIGVDRFGRRTTNAMHTAFVGSSARARQLSEAYEALRTRDHRDLNIRHSLIRPQHLLEVGVCSHRTFRCDETHPFRTFDGSCNNLQNPAWGMAYTQMRRFLPPCYDDGQVYSNSCRPFTYVGISRPRVTAVDGSPLPSARLVSTTIHQSDEHVPKLRGLTNMLMQWGQFLDHDIALAPVHTGVDGRPLTCCLEDVPVHLRGRPDIVSSERCFPIDIPLGDHRFPHRRCMQFPRSIQVNNINCTGAPAEQLNQLTAFVDASNVYGSDEREARQLREFGHGLLRVSEDDLLPFDNDTLEVCTDRCFRAGDERANAQMGLTSIHTLFMREHNRIARRLHQINPDWDDERLYHETRKIIGAMMQQITYNDFLPVVLNRDARLRFGLESPRYGYNNVYDRNVDASIRNGFAASAFRFGHSLLPSFFSRVKPDFSERNSVRLRDLFGNTRMFRDTRGQIMNELLRGELLDRASQVDRFLTPEVTDFLFETTNSSLDLAALNIQRGRDHGVPSYTFWREWCGLSRVTNFGTGPGGLIDHDPITARQLARVYRNPQDIDLYTGGLSEIPVRGGLVGPTFTCIIANQFSLLKRGDRFWFETDDANTGFTAEQLREIRKVSLSRIICDNTDTFFLQGDAFRTISTLNPLLYCDQLPQMDLAEWREGSVVRGHWGPWSGWSDCHHGNPIRFRTRERLPPGSRCAGSSIQQSRCDFHDFHSNRYPSK